MEVRKSVGRIPSLDGIRAISIALVLIGHASHTTGFPWANWRFDGLANTGVRIFFVLSGFLITSLLMTEADARGSISLGQFYLRRAFRIFPAFYAYLLLVTFLAVLQRVPVTRWDLAFAYGYLSNFRPGQFHLLGHLWSLSVEEQFYLVWPAIMAFASMRLRRLALGLAVLAPPVLRLYFAAHPRLAPFIDQSTFTICDVLAVGCLLALHREQLHRRQIYRAMLTWTGVLGLLFFCVCLLESVKIWPNGFLITQSMQNIALAIAVDALIVLAPRALNGAMIMRIGTWSYSIYLWQQLFCSSKGHWWNLFPINVAISVAVAYGSYRWIEQPMLRVRNRWTSHESGPRHAGARVEAALSTPRHVSEEVAA